MTLHCIVYWVVFWDLWIFCSCFSVWVDLINTDWVSNCSLFSVQCGLKRLLTDLRVKLWHIYRFFFPPLFHLLKLRSSCGESHARSSDWRAGISCASHAASSRYSCMFDCTENESEKCMRAFSFLIHRSNYTPMSPPPPCTKWKTNQEVQPSYECTWQTSATNHGRLDGVPEDVLDWISIKLAAGSFDVNRCIGATAKKVVYPPRQEAVRHRLRWEFTAQQKYTKNIFLLSAVIKLRAACWAASRRRRMQSHIKTGENSILSRPQGPSAAATPVKTDRSTSVCPSCR